MIRPVFCAVADDDTGATDIAGMLSAQGVRTLLIVDPAVCGCSVSGPEQYEAVVIGTGTRALSPHAAYEETRAAVRQLRSWNPRVLAIKYCSTFDSTPEGNIGPSLDAAMDESGESFTVALPALPVNGRTTYMGYHFVHQQLLSESPMRNHPLTPMREANLIRHLQSQTRRCVGLAHYPVSRAQLEQLQKDGVEIAILDCISDADLEGVCESIAHLQLVSGSSALASKLPAIWRRQGWCSHAASSVRRPKRTGSGFLVVAGSCSTATTLQNASLADQGVETVTVDPLALLADARVDCGRIREVLEQDRPYLLRTASSPQDVERVSNEMSRRGLSAAEGGRLIAYALAQVVLQILEMTSPAGLIVAGGETSTAICRTLELGAFDVGSNIEPGVPLCISQGRFQLPVVLKSGNFGSPNFYSKAIQAIQELS